MIEEARKIVLSWLIRTTGRLETALFDPARLTYWTEMQRIFMGSALWHLTSSAEGLHGSVLGHWCQRVHHTLNVTKRSLVLAGPDSRTSALRAAPAASLAHASWRRVDDYLLPILAYAFHQKEAARKLRNFH